MIRRLFSLACVGSVLGAATSFAAQPEVKWVYEGLSNLYPAPPVADMDGRAELYCPAGSDNALYCLDALTGVVRWTFPMQGGAGVYNGMTWGIVGEDRPFSDMSGVDIPGYASNECWLPHNTAYLNALVNPHVAK